MRFGPWMPTATTSSMMVSTTKIDDHGFHIFTPNEIAFLHGWPVTERSLPKFRRFAKVNFNELPNISLQRMALGNGFHLGHMLAFWVYILANTVKVKELYKVSPGVVGFYNHYTCNVSEDSGGLGWVG